MRFFLDNCVFLALIGQDHLGSNRGEGAVAQGDWLKPFLLFPHSILSPHLAPCTLSPVAGLNWDGHRYPSSTLEGFLPCPSRHPSAPAPFQNRSEVD